MKHKFRLTRSTDFQRVRRIGKTYAHPLVVFTIAPNQMDQVRIGVVAGRSVGNAVKRNRMKRRLRSSIDMHLENLNGSWDMVFLARKPMDQASFEEIRAAITLLLTRAGLLNDRSSTF